VALKADPTTLSSSGPVEFTTTIESASGLNPPFMFKYDFDGDRVSDAGKAFREDTMLTNTQTEIITSTTTVSVLVVKIDSNGVFQSVVGSDSKEITVNSG